MSIQNLVGESLKFYDTHQKMIRYMMKYWRFELISSTSDTQRAVMTFRNRITEEKEITTETEVLAIYYEKYHLWLWSWSHPFATSSQSYLARQMLLYALNLGPDMTYIKSLLVTSKGIIQDPIQVDINLAVAAGIIKQPYIYPNITYIDDYALIHYYILINRDEIDEYFQKYVKDLDI